MAYNPVERELTTTYVVHTTGDRFFIPELAPDATMANQLAQCEALVGTGKAGATVASEVVAT